MAKGGRINEQRDYQDPFYRGYREPYPAFINNQPQRGDYVPPGTGSIIDPAGSNTAYAIGRATSEPWGTQQGFNGSPGKGMRPQPYGGFGGYQQPFFGRGFGGGFGGYQQPAYGVGFGGYQPSNPYGGSFGNRPFAQGYGIQGGIGSLLSNYPSYIPPRMSFNPYMR